MGRLLASASVLLGLLAALPAYGQCESCPAVRVCDISARVERSTNQTIPIGAEGAIAFDTELFDTGNTAGMESTTGMWVQSSPSRLMVSTAGKYLIIGHVEHATGGPNSVEVRIRKNGTTRFARVIEDPGTGTTTQTVMTYQQLAMGDYIEMTVFWATSSSLEVLAGNPPALSLVKLP